MLKFIMMLLALDAINSIRSWKMLIKIYIGKNFEIIPLKSILAIRNSALVNEIFVVLLSLKLHLRFFW